MRRALAAAAAARQRALRRAASAGACAGDASAARPLHASASPAASSAAPSHAAEPETMSFDVCIVGAGPAGLAAAIRIRQLCDTLHEDVSVCVLEKGAEVGAHSLSGNVFDPRALDELIPDWRARGAPVTQPALRDDFLLLSERHALRLPTPPQQRNGGNFIISLSQLTRWLGAQAEELGAVVLPGFPAAALLHAGGALSGGELPPLSGAPVLGIATADAGRGRDGAPGPRFVPGARVRARATLLAEGARGHLSEAAVAAFCLRAAAGACAQTYALGIKEVWRVPPAAHAPGTVVHTVGFPLDARTYGGGFLYHMGDPGLVALGLVVALDYRNPHLSPFQEFQRWKTHPAISRTLRGGAPLQYGARALVEGGLQSLPALAFPGGALLGDAAGTLNVPKIKGTHTAMKSGELAGEAAFAAVLAARAQGEDALADMGAYPLALRASWVWRELHAARNIRPGFAAGGLWGGLTHAAVDTYLFRGAAPWTLRHGAPDHAALAPAAASARIAYPPPDNALTFDVPTSLARSGTDHAHEQPPHLRLTRGARAMEALNRDVYAGPEARYCPAGVYEWLPPADGAADKAQLVINAQNCLHCKACDIKDPGQNIKWTPPEGGGGPAYTVM